MAITLTKQQARQFILRKQGLSGEYRFSGKEGILEYIRQCGCIQFDPIDVCGKNAELVLQSRIQGFTKQMLYELLYEERKLIDFFDKNLAILPTADWPYFERIRQGYREWGRGRDEVDNIAPQIKEMIRTKGIVSSKDIGFTEKVDWYWSSSKLARVALESLYFRGELIIHHKKGTNKYYALSQDYIPKELLEAGEPYPRELDHLKWRILRRISAVGLLWNKPSDAWLNIWNLKSQERNAAFEELLKEEELIELEVEGCKERLYCVRSDQELLRQTLEAGKEKERTELIAPLDCMMWDRELVNFDYKWEIYTPQEQRKYGYYVLPMIQGERFVARVELTAQYKQKQLVVKNIWLEQGIRSTNKLQKDMERCFKRFMKFHGLSELTYLNEEL
jgi:uncharacterized protein YcaQ